MFATTWNGARVPAAAPDVANGYAEIVVSQRADGEVIIPGVPDGLKRLEVAGALEGDVSRLHGDDGVGAGVLSTSTPSSQTSTLLAMGKSELGMTGPEAKSREEPVMPGSGTSMKAK